MVFLFRPRISTAGVVIAEHREYGVWYGASRERCQNAQNGEKYDSFHGIAVLRRAVRQFALRCFIYPIGTGKLFCTLITGNPQDHWNPNER